MAIRCSTPIIRTPLTVSTTLPDASFTISVQVNPLKMVTRWRAVEPSTNRLTSVTKGHQFRNSPMRNISIDRVITFLQKTASPAASSRGITKAMALPTANRKKGNTRSVGVKPCQGACSRGSNICPQLPGLFTRIIRHTVAPLKTSSE